MPQTIDAATLKAWLSDAAEMALFDVREPGQFGEGHLFFAVPLPYSRFELDLPALAPNPAVRMVLCDAGDGVAAVAAERAAALGYQHIHVLAGGVQAWRQAGFTLYAGVNVPSKTFGELIEHARHTPRVSAAELHRLQRAGENVVVLDGRPFAEYQRMSIPGGICCPNGELGLRYRDLVPDPTTRIVVNCAGRTRSIIGAQTLIDLGIENPVYALENGTQGWLLAGLEVDRGAEQRYRDQVAADTQHLARRVAQARAVADRHGVAFIAADLANAWLADAHRTTYTLDVRTAEEVAAEPAPGFVHAPGGQLLQATDQWVGVRRARQILLDTDGIRAPLVAGWLRQLGHGAAVLEGGLAAARQLERPAAAINATLPALAEIEPQALSLALSADQAGVVDLRASQDYRQGHIPDAVWSIRPRVLQAAQGWDPGRTIVLVAEAPSIAQLAAIDLTAAGWSDVRLLAGGMPAWSAAGLPTLATPEVPPDADRIDFLFFVHDRHLGNLEAARGYLAWEMGLIAQLDDQERGVFRIAEA